MVWNRRIEKESLNIVVLITNYIIIHKNILKIQERRIREKKKRNDNLSLRGNFSHNNTHINVTVKLTTKKEKPKLSQSHTSC